MLGVNAVHVCAADTSHHAAARGGTFGGKTMRKAFACIATLAMVGCGGSGAGGPADVASNAPDPGVEVGTIALPLKAGTELLKIVVRRSELVTENVVDDNGTITGTQDVFREVFKYIRHIDPRTTGSIAIPHGADYTIEAFAGGPEAAGVRRILAYYKSEMFSVPAALPPTFTEQLPLEPTLAFPTIYVGLGAPYDTYTVPVTVSYPWSTTGWSLTCQGGPPPTMRGSNATFVAPTQNGPLTYDAKFLLDRTLLLGGEDASSWAFTFRPSKTPVPSEAVPVIP